MSFIKVENLSKDFYVRKRYKSFFGTVKSMFCPEMHKIEAVKNISFEINKSEKVGYIGPNGAGKSTTIKILSGILTPTKGQVAVNGLIPYKNRKINALKMGVVFGQRSQLYWDLPLMDSLDTFKTMYRVSETKYKESLEYLTEVLYLEEILYKPVRQCSLGQKMRANLAAAFLHQPEVVYLDEPTIGLDVMVKADIRKFINDINRNLGTTIILTTHDLDDIEDICDRVILINEGEIFFDGELKTLKEKYSSGTEVVFEVHDDKTKIEAVYDVKIKQQTGSRVELFVKNKKDIQKIISYYLSKYAINDITIKETPLEDIIKNIYLK